MNDRRLVKQRHAQAREMTGKTPVNTIIARWWLFGGIPGALGILFIFLMGGWILVPGLAIGWFVVVFLFPLLQRAIINTGSDIIQKDRPGYRKWREGGGDPYADAQFFPFNNDSLETREAVAELVPEGKHMMFTDACTHGHSHAPPDRKCPRCGTAWNMEYFQCDWCFTYWDVQGQCYFYFEPDPRTYTPRPRRKARRAIVEDDPSIYTPKRRREP